MHENVCIGNTNIYVRIGTSIQALRYRSYQKEIDNIQKYIDQVFSLCTDMMENYAKQ